jgi:hypothetical protein
VVRWVIVLALVVAGALLLAAPDEERPLAVVGRTGATSLPATAAAPPSTSPPPTTKPAVATPNRSSTAVRHEAGGVTVTNEGSARASTGGNTVVGAPDGASVVNGPVTAVGNASEVRITPS